MKYSCVFLFAFGLLFMTACDSNTKGSKSKSKAKTESAENVTPESNSVNINALNLYLETSGSMVGYLNGDTEFKAILSRLIATLERGETQELVSNTNYFLIPEGTKIDTVKNADTFQDLLTNNRLAKGKNSLIVDILKMLQSKNEKGTVDIFISDFILSDFKISDKDIVESRVSMLFNKNAASGTATSIYAFTSQFNGNTIKQKSKPFYIWFFGDSKALLELNRILIKNRFEPEEEMHLGMNFNSTPDFQLLNSTGKAGEGDYMPTEKNKSMKILSMYKNKPIQMTLGLNLSDYPEWISDEKQLKKNLEFIGSENLKGKIVAVENKSSISLKGKDASRATDNNLTHFVTYELQEVKGNKAHFELVLNRKSAQDWHEEWSTMESARTTENKTFAFAHLVNGLKSAYSRAEEKPYFTVKVNVNKE